MLQKFLRVARVFAGNLVDFFRMRRARSVMSSKFPTGVATSVFRPDPLHEGWIAAPCKQSSTQVGVCRTCYTAVFKTQSEEPALPLYEYQCLKCGKKTEKIESVSGPHLKKCPHCGGKVERLAVRSSDSVQGLGLVCDGLCGKIERAGRRVVGFGVG